MIVPPVMVAVPAVLINPPVTVSVPPCISKVPFVPVDKSLPEAVPTLKSPEEILINPLLLTENPVLLPELHFSEAPLTQTPAVMGMFGFDVN